MNTIAAVHLPEWHAEARAFGAQTTVGEVMTRDVPSVHESATLEEVFALLVSSTHKRVVVADDQRHVVGIIADSDLLAKVSRESWPGVMEPGDIICRKGEYELDLCLILGGGVDLIDRYGEDDQVPVAALEARNLYGELGAIGGLPRTLDVIAHKD
jgi:hypothetical protein